MGTPATLIVEFNDEFRVVTVNFDGYPEHMMSILTNYDSPCAVEELLSMGDARFLDDNIESSQFYHRDAGEDFEILKYRVYPSAIQAKRSEIGQYAYLYADGIWAQF